MKKVVLFFLAVAYFITGISQTRINVPDLLLPDHGGDYRIAIKTAIDMAVANDIDTIYFPAGTYKVGYKAVGINTADDTCTADLTGEKTQVRTAIRLCNISKLLVFAGDGETSIIELGAISDRGDYHIFQLIASDSIRFLNITLNGSGGFNNYHSDHRHLVSVHGCKNIAFENVLFKNAKDDGIYLLGLSAIRKTKDVIIKGCNFISNGRSGVAFQRHIEGVSISRSEFSFTSDQDIDFEPSGLDERFVIRDVSIAFNKFTHINSTYSVTFSNGEDIRFNNNVMINGCINARHLKHFLITNNQLITDNYDWTIAPRIYLAGDVINGQIISNIIDSTRNNSAIHFSHHNHKIANHIQIVNNTIYGALWMGDVKNVLIEGNTIIGKKAVLGTIGINFETESATAQKETIVVRNNTISNFGKGIQLAPKKSNYTSALIENNFFQQIGDSCIYYAYSDSKERGRILQTPKLLYNRYGTSSEFYKKIRGFTRYDSVVIYGYNGDLQTPVYLGNTVPPNSLFAPANSLYIYYNPKVNIIPNPQYYLRCSGGIWRRAELGCQ